MHHIASFEGFNRLFEQNTNYPIKNGPNPVPTDSEKSMIAEFNKFLQVIADPKITYSQKDTMRSKVLGFFSKDKCTIADHAGARGDGNWPNPAPKPLYDTYTNTDDWFESVIQKDGGTNDDGSVRNIKYDIGVMYFSVDNQGKITDMQVG
jgi:hypothetical protein